MTKQSNPFRIEYETQPTPNGGIGWPTLIIFTKKPSKLDMRDAVQLHPELLISPKPVDKAGCVFKVELKYEQTPGALAKVKAQHEAAEKGFV